MWGVGIPISFHRLQFLTTFLWLSSSLCCLGVLQAFTFLVDRTGGKGGICVGEEREESVEESVKEVAVRGNDLMPGKKSHSFIFLARDS